MTEPLLDPSVFDDLSEAMGADFAGELVTTFLDDAPNMLAALRDAAASGDTDAFRRAAHSIKSNADVFGARALAARARAMEMTALSDGTPPIPQLEATYDATATVLRARLDE